MRFIGLFEALVVNVSHVIFPSYAVSDLYKSYSYISQSLDPQSFLQLLSVRIAFMLNSFSS